MSNKIVNFTRSLYASLFLIAFVIGGQAQNQIDPTFNAVPAMPSSVEGQIIQPDGKIVVWGDALTVGGVAKGQLARLNADGSLDNSFSYCGCYFPVFSSVVIQPDGKLVLAGQGFNYDAKVVRLNTDGSLDGGFNYPFSAGSVAQTRFAQVFTLQPDGKILIGTSFSSSFGTGRSVSRLNTDGSVDSSFAGIDLGFGRSFGTYVTSTSIMPDGKILLALSSYGPESFNGSLRRYNADGTVDSTWEQPSFTIGGAQNTTSVDSVDHQADGSVVVGGHFDGVNGLAKFHFVRLLSAGNVDTSFNSTGFVSGNQIQVLSTGKILVKAITGLGNPHKIYRLNSDGSTDGTFVFDPAISDVLKDWSLDASGRIVFYGQPASAGAARLYRLNVNGDIDAGFNPNIGKMGQIFASAIQPDGKLLVAGNFIQMNGIAKTSLARLNTNGSVDASFDAGSGFSTAPKALLLQPDGKILAVGSFGSYNGVPRTGLVRINTDGSIDAAFNPIFGSKPVGIALQSDGKIIVVGPATTVNGVSRTGIARLNTDGALDTGFAPVVGSPNLMSVAVGPDDKIVFSGTFSGVDGFGRSNLARLNSNGSLDASFNAGSGGTASVLNILPDGKILLNGRVRRNTDGSVDPGYVAPTIANGTDSSFIDTVLVQTDGSVIVGGLFTTVNSIPHNNIVRLSSTGALDPLFFPNGSDGEIRTMTAGASGKVIIGGDFTKFDNSIRAGIVRVNTVVFHKAALFDFDGDGRADISVTRSAGVDTWYQLLGASYTFNQVNFGQTGDVVAPADFDGDGKTDVAIYRPSNGQWWYISSLDGSQRAATWVGQAGDIALPSDYNGDGKADYILYRPSTGQWLRLPNGGLTSFNITFGTVGDKPLVGDFDGDGKSDPAIFRPSTGTFWYAASSQNDAQRAFQWGSATDIPAVADYDGDGKTDYAIYRPSSGQWWVFNSSTQNYTVVTWGAAEDKPIPADYDGDGKADFAVFRPSNGTWYLLTSTSGFKGFQWGISTDVPSPGAFVP